MKRLSGCLLFALVFIATWRIAGVMVDLALLSMFIVMLAVCRYWPRKTKK